MFARFPSVPRIPAAALQLFIQLIIAGIFCRFYFLYTWEFGPGGMARMMDFSAVKVFQGRILPVLFVHGLDLAGFPWDLPWQSFRLPVSSAMEFGFFLWTLLSQTLLQIGFLRWLGETRLIQAALFTAILLFLEIWQLIFLNNLYYPYDVSALAFFVWGMALLPGRPLSVVVPFLVLATLNRESSLFLVLGLILLRIDWRPKLKDTILSVMRDRSLLLFVLVCAGTWISLKQILQWIFRHNPGKFYETPENYLQFLNLAFTNQPHWAHYGRPPIGPLVAGSATWHFTILFFFWALIPVALHRLSGPDKALLWIIPAYLLIASQRSNLMEPRVYLELVPLFAWIAARLIQAAGGRRSGVPVFR